MVLTRSKARDPVPVQVRPDAPVRAPPRPQPLRIREPERDPVWWTFLQGLFALVMAFLFLCYVCVCKAFETTMDLVSSMILLSAPVFHLSALLQRGSGNPVSFMDKFSVLGMIMMATLMTGPRHRPGCRAFTGLVGFLFLAVCVSAAKEGMMNEYHVAPAGFLQMLVFYVASVTSPQPTRLDSWILGARPRRE
jgi:peptidoglycan/LPS O-acetylase OafA/YrhL